MNQLWFAIAGILCNVGAQIAIKFAGHKIELKTGLLAWFNPELFIAIGLYGLAFLFTVKVFAANPITVAGPVMAGATFVLVGVAGALVFAEAVTLTRIAGMALILAGILLVTRSA